MEQHEAAEFIAAAVGEAGRAWADLGAGTGTFTRALRSLLPRGGRIYSIDNDPRAVAALRSIGDDVVPVRADFTKGLAIPGVGTSSLDGLLFANSLHFVPDAAGVLRQLVDLVRPAGRVVIVEYDRRAASRWVPYPIRSDHWPALAAAAGLTNARVTSRRPSEYAGELYVGVAERSIGS